MGFNYGYERKKFDAKWKRLRTEYSALGMSEEDIEAMHSFDWEQFKEERNHRMHNQPIEGAAFSDSDEDDEDYSTLYKRHLEQMSCCQPEICEWSREAWVQDLDTPEYVKLAMSLTEKQFEVLTCIVADGLSQADVARKMGVSRAAISKVMDRIAKIYKGALSRG